MPNASRLGGQPAPDGPTRGPLCPEVGVVGLVPERWSDLWQPRHQVMRRLTRYFPVAWVNPAHEWRESFTRRGGPSWAGDPADPGWWIYTPAWYLPRVHRPRAVGDALLKARVRAAARGLRRRGARHTVVYLWRPIFAPALETPHDLSCYHIDDDYSFSPVERPLDPAEVALIRRAGLVIIHSPGLLETKGRLNPRTHHVPNGVDYQALARPQPEPTDLAPIPHPRVGYCGWLKPQLDWPLLLRLAREHPHWSLVFVGGAKPDLSEEPYLELRRLPNAYFLGRKTTAELTAYPHHFDVCLMPYRVNPYTNGIYPLKLHEYLATGRPVVGAPIRSLRDFAEVVSLAATPEEWSAGIDRALSAGATAPAACELRQRVAREHDWNALVERIARLIVAGLEPAVAASWTPCTWS